MNDESALDLSRNAYDFLNESLRNAQRATDNPRLWKFAIVNIAQAIELLLKERLRREHRLLVYTDVDRKRNTVNVDQALGRLASCNISLDEEDIARHRRARDIRNNIIHFDIVIDEEQLYASYVDLFEFIHTFHLNALGQEIHNFIDEELWIQEAMLMEDFRREFIQYNGGEVIKTFPSEILDAQFIMSYRIEGRLYERIRWSKSPSGEFDYCGDCCVLFRAASYAGLRHGDLPKVQGAMA